MLRLPFFGVIFRPSPEGYNDEPYESSEEDFGDSDAPVPKDRLRSASLNPFEP